MYIQMQFKGKSTDEIKTDRTCVRRCFCLIQSFGLYGCVCTVHLMCSLIKLYVAATCKNYHICNTYLDRKRVIYRVDYEMT
jgi:hypothetical protein